MRIIKFFLLNAAFAFISFAPAEPEELTTHCLLLMLPMVIGGFFDDYASPVGKLTRSFFRVERC